MVHGTPLVLQGPFVSAGGHLVIHEFLYLLGSPIPLLGRDLLTKLGAQITFAPGKSASLTLGRQSALMMAMTISREDEWCLLLREQINPPRLLKEFPDVWEEKWPPGLAKNSVPIVVDLRPGATPVRQKQYPVSQEACLGIWDHIQHPQNAQILIEHQSPWNTPILPVKRSGGNDYYPVQDLHTINSAVITIHPVVPNSYTLLSLLPTQASWFTCLHLKDASFCLQLSPASPCLPLNGKTHTLGERHS